MSLFFAARLPSLDGGSPPDHCPICGAAQVPPGSDEGLPPPEEHQYACDGTYLRPEGAPGPWEPCRTCRRVPIEAAGAWIRDLCARRGSAAAGALAGAVGGSPPYALGESLPLEVAIGAIQGERAPETCPACGAAGEPDRQSFMRYACGALLWSTSLRPTPTGYVAMSFQGLSECPRAPLRRLLEVLRDEARRRGDERLGAAADDALRALDGEKRAIPGGDGRP